MGNRDGNSLGLVGIVLISSSGNSIGRVKDQAAWATRETCPSVCLYVGLATGIAKLIHYRVVFPNIPDIGLADP